MNKYDEALTYIENMVVDSESDGYYNQKTVIDFEPIYCARLRELVDKATPKKPIVNSCDDHVHYKCQCGRIHITKYHARDGMSELMKGHKPKYCEDCGQEIDWSDFE